MILKKKIRLDCFVGCCTVVLIVIVSSRNVLKVLKFRVFLHLLASFFLFVIFLLWFSYLTVAY